MSFVVLGLGSNRPIEGLSCVQLLASACNAMKPFISSMRVASVYRTGAMYVTDQSDFYNTVLTGFYDSGPYSLLNDIHRVEARFGRDRSREIRNGPRSLDIDIEIFGGVRMASPELTVPHERLCERAFVLRPLMDVLEVSAHVSAGDMDFYRECLKNAGDQKIELFMDSEKFRELMGSL